MCKDRLANEQQREKLSKQLSLMKNLVQQLQANGLKKIILNEYKTGSDEDRREPIDNDTLINELTVTLIQVGLFKKIVPSSNVQIYDYN